METLVKTLKAYIKQLPDNEARILSDQNLEKLYSIFPFNKFEFVISHLIADGVMSLHDYIMVRQEYLRRNKYLYLFELAPRTFGQEWGERHLLELIPELSIPHMSVDSGFNGEYDLYFEGLKIEVKASRAVLKRGGGSLVEKALDSGSLHKFDMNFQQLKPNCCDVFIWIAVWRDKIDYWILTADDVRTHPGFSNQHRRQANDFSDGIFEGQIHINALNYHEFDKYRVNIRQILPRLRDLAKTMRKH